MEGDERRTIFAFFVDEVDRSAFGHVPYFEKTNFIESANPSLGDNKYFGSIALCLCEHLSIIIDGDSILSNKGKYVIHFHMKKLLPHLKYDVVTVCSESSRDKFDSKFLEQTGSTLMMFSDFLESVKRQTDRVPLKVCDVSLTYGYNAVFVWNEQFESGHVTWEFGKSFSFWYVTFPKGA